MLSGELSPPLRRAESAEHYCGLLLELKSFELLMYLKDTHIVSCKLTETGTRVQVWQGLINYEQKFRFKSHSDSESEVAACGSVSKPKQKSDFIYIIYVSLSVCL